MPKSLAVFLLAAFTAIPPSAAWAAPITMPPGLQPGDQYRLAFVTDMISAFPATSSNIADYNAFVTAKANTIPALVALTTTWSAIGSTATVDARDNTSTNPNVSVGFPIYTLDGAIIATNNAGLWSGFLLNPLDISENGFQTSALVWTGSNTAGIASNPLGGSLTTPNIGADINRNFEWMAYNPFILNGARSPLNFYAISGVLTVPAPEPSSMVLAFFAAAGLTIVAIRKRRTR